METNIPLFKKKNISDIWTLNSHRCLWTSIAGWTGAEGQCCCSVAMNISCFGKPSSNNMKRTECYPYPLALVSRGGGSSRAAALVLEAKIALKSQFIAKTVHHDGWRGLPVVGAGTCSRFCVSLSLDQRCWCLIIHALWCAVPTMSASSMDANRTNNRRALSV